MMTRMHFTTCARSTPSSCFIPRPHALLPAAAALHVLTSPPASCAAAAGKHHTLVVTAGGESFAFGGNMQGQLGRGSIKAKAKEEGGGSCAACCYRPSLVHTCSAVQQVPTYWCLPWLPHPRRSTSTCCLHSRSALHCLPLWLRQPVPHLQCNFLQQSGTQP
jgi:hypothetical protein